MRQVLGPGALGRPRGIGWRGRWEGGSGWGIHVKPWLIHVNVWQKPLEYCKVISLQLIKIMEKKRTKLEENKVSPNWNISMHSPQCELFPFGLLRVDWLQMEKPNLYLGDLPSPTGVINRVELNSRFQPIISIQIFKTTINELVLKVTLMVCVIHKPHHCYHYTCVVISMYQALF